MPRKQDGVRYHKQTPLLPSTTNQRTDAAHLALEVVLWAQELVNLQRAREAARVRNGVHSGRQAKEVVLEVHVAQHGSKRPKHYWAETHHDDATAAANVLHKKAI